MKKSTIDFEIIKKYKSNIFVETGTSNGAATILAVLAGYEKIYSIEINAEKQEKNRKHFAGYKHVHLITGDSLKEMQRIIPALDKQATFWLDAHYEKTGPKGEKSCPIIDELYAIYQSPIKNHIIMIDDMRIFEKRSWGKRIKKSDILEMIVKINPNYNITYEDSRMAKNDILVAHV